MAKAKVTTVRLTAREVARLEYLKDRLAMGDAQIIRTAVNWFYDSVLRRDRLELKDAEYSSDSAARKRLHHE